MKILLLASCCGLSVSCIQYSTLHTDREVRIDVSYHDTAISAARVPVAVFYQYKPHFRFFAGQGEFSGRTDRSGVITLPLANQDYRMNIKVGSSPWTEVPHIPVVEAEGLLLPKKSPIYRVRLSPTHQAEQDAAHLPT